MRQVRKQIDMASYDRYSQFRVNDEIRVVPFGKVPEQSTDFYEVYEKGKSRLDLISYDYYKDAGYGWLILQANPAVGSMEYEIEDRTTLRIPYPLGTALDRYRNSIEEYYKLYGYE